MPRDAPAPLDPASLKELPETANPTFQAQFEQDWSDRAPTRRAALFACVAAAEELIECAT